METNWFLTPLLQTIASAAFRRAALPLSSQLHFSSTSAIWSQPGAGHYAAGNSYLDLYAASMQQMGWPGTAVLYGPFAGAGMAVAYTNQLEALGLRSLGLHQVCQMASAAMHAGWARKSGG